MKTINLNGTWQLHNAQRSVEVKATIPGDNISALLSAKKIPDPFWSDNEQKVQWVNQDDWIYEREFQVPASFLAEASASINIENLDTVATISINGRKVAQTDNAFVRYRFEVKKYLKPGLNKISITLSSAEREAKARAAKLPYPVPHSVYPVQSPHRNLMRKVQCHAGWDWGPCLMVSGIYGNIYVKAVSQARIEHVYTDQKHSRNEVAVTVHCEIESPEGGNVPFEVELGGQKISSVAKLKPGLNRLQKVVRIRNPKIWWPHDYGAQPLYDLVVRVGDDSLQKRIGLRTIEVVNENDKDGLSMVFLVNGAPVFCKGANWIPADALPQRQTRAVLDDLLNSATAAHMNMLRVWGGGQYETDDFYELCDEKGLLIWQDFMFSCSMYPATPDFLESVKLEAEYQVKRLRDHACLALWCGNNENLGAMTWFNEVKANRDRYIVDYDRLNEGVLGAAVRKHDPTHLFWPSSPCGGEGDYSANWHDDRRGDMHYWSVWFEGKPFSEFFTVKPRFCSEFGYQSFPSVESIRTYAPADQFNIVSPIMEYHQRNPGGNTRITEMMMRYYRFPEAFDKFIYLSQVLQATAIKTAVEHFRRLRPLCMGALYWQINDMWPVCSWSSLEYGGKWKMLHYFAKRFFAPLMVTSVPTEDGVEIWAVNDRLKPVEANLRVRVVDFSGKTLLSFGVKKRLPAGSSVLLKKYAIKNLVDHPTQAFLSFDLKAGGETASNEHFFAEYKKCALPKVKIRTKTEAARSGFAVTLTADAPAFSVRLDVTGVRGEFDDNGFCLLPGEPKRVVFTPKEEVSLKQFGEKLTLCHLRETYA